MGHPWFDVKLCAGKRPYPPKQSTTTLMVTLYYTIGSVSEGRQVDGVGTAHRPVYRKRVDIDSSPNQSNNPEARVAALSNQRREPSPNTKNRTHTHKHVFSSCLAGNGRGVRPQKILGSFFSLPLAAVPHRSEAASRLVRVLHNLEIALGERLLRQTAPA